MRTGERYRAYLATITCLTCATAAGRLLLDGIGEVAGAYYARAAAVDPRQLVHRRRDGAARAAVVVAIRGVVARPLQTGGEGGRRHVPVPCTVFTTVLGDLASAAGYCCWRTGENESESQRRTTRPVAAAARGVVCARSSAAAEVVLVPTQMQCPDAVQVPAQRGRIEGREGWPIEGCDVLERCHVLVQQQAHRSS